MLDIKKKKYGWFCKKTRGKSYSLKQSGVARFGVQDLLKLLRLDQAELFSPLL